MQVIVIVGPTGIGKTKLSIALAQKLNGEIINGDSTQVYKGLDVATAKITEEEKENIPHHLFDIRTIEENYTVFDYQKDCRKKIEEIVSRGHLPIIVGGTGLYLKAALYDYQFVNEGNHQDYSSYTNEELYQMVLQKDTNNKIHPNNRKRLIRALEYMEFSKQPFSQKEKNDVPLYDILWIGLTTDRETLYNRINLRTEKMMEQGLVEEAKIIYDSKIRTKGVLTPIGYKELFPYFEKQRSLEESLEEIKKNTRHYAKRQYTWFYHQVPVSWFQVDFDCFQNTIDEVLKKIDHFKSK